MESANVGESGHVINAATGNPSRQFPDEAILLAACGGDPRFLWVDAKCGAPQTFKETDQFLARIPSRLYQTKTVIPAETPAGLPEPGTATTVYGPNCDGVGTEAIVIAYSPDGAFAWLRKDGCWPFTVPVRPGTFA